MLLSNLGKDQPKNKAGGKSEVLSKAELMQQVIHEDFKRIVEDMRVFRVEHYGHSLSQITARNSMITKNALSRRWMVFYHNMINLGIFFLSSHENRD